MTSREQTLYQSTVAALRRGDLKQAIAACRELNTAFPDFFDGWCIAGDIHQRLGKPKAGLIAAERALALRPDDGGALLQKVESLIALGDDSAALQLLSTADTGSWRHADLYDRAGRSLARLDHHEPAMHHYRQALELEPGNSALWYNLATAQRFLGQIDAAELSLDRALALEPLDFEAQAMRSSLRKQTPQNNHVNELTEVLTELQKKTELAPGGSVSIHYALARELDDLDYIEQSFSHLQRGADARRAQMQYDVQTDVTLIDALIENFSAELMRQPASGSDNREPIFILGMPRTGTTLVERILGSHSAVYAAGELDTFGREMMQQLGQKHDLNGVPRAQLIARSTALDNEALGDAYVAGTRPTTGHTAHFIDKLPFNFLYAGLIHRALPKARIINLVRHPMATCYAVYKQLFRDAYPFSYSLEDLGHYYVAYHRLMNHWHSVMPGGIYSVAYEDVVGDLEGEAKKLLQYCDLPFEQQCLQFHENRQASTTASATQVRQPIYSSSLDRWRKYQKHLTPVERILAQAGIKTD